MAREPRTFSRMSEAEGIIKKLVEKFPDVLWAVEPSTIAVMGVDNAERSEKVVKKSPVYAKLRVIRGSEKALFQENNVNVLYVIELYWSDWHNWNDSLRQAVLLSQLLEITPEEESRNRPDCVGFKVFLDALGVNWDGANGTNIPNLLQDDIAFNLDLRPGLEDVSGESDNNTRRYCPVRSQNTFAIMEEQERLENEERMRNISDAS